MVRLVATDSPDFLALSEEEQAFLQGIAADLINTLEEAERAIAKKYGEEHLDQDEQLALWGLLPAKVRTAIKRANAVVAAPCTECGVAGAHTRNCSIGGRFA